MTDSNGTPRTIVSSDATQLMRPYDNPVKAQPVDLPKSGFGGGYQAHAVEERIAELTYQIGVLTRNREELQRVIAAKQTENGRLNQRIADLADENKRLKHEAENPVEALGKVGQELINAAKAQADDIRAKVRKEAEAHMADSNRKADAAIAQAERNAAATVAQAKERADGLDAEAQAHVRDAHAQADRIVAQAKEVADRLDAESKERAKRAGDQQTRAANAVLEAKATLKRLLEDLA